MVKGEGINAGMRHFAQHAHVLTGIRHHQHRNQRMQQHAFGQQCRFNGVRGRLLVHPADLDLADHGQRDRARGGDAYRGMKLRRVVLADVEKVAGTNGSGHG